MSTLSSALPVCRAGLAVCFPPPGRVACKIYPVPSKSWLSMPPFLPPNRPHSAPCGREFVSSPNYHAYRLHMEVLQAFRGRSDFAVLRLKTSAGS